MKFEKYFDHTLLKADATEEQIEKVCQEAIEMNCASVCVNSAYTSLIAEKLADTDIAKCVVVGFPLGAMSSKAKAYEAECAVADGADEIDMVINVGALKAGNTDLVFEDIKQVREACKGKILKVIIETCLLSDEEKIKAFQLALKAQADFVKTSTGFSTGGAKVEDVRLMKKTVGNQAKVKASGGIRDYKTACEMLEAGAERLGTSATRAIIEAYKAENK